MNSLQSSVEKLTYQVASSLSVDVGSDFFPALLDRLGSALRADYAMVTELMAGDPAQGRTLIVMSKGDILDNLEYRLAGTPCEQVVLSAACIYPRDVQRLFPEDQHLVKLDVVGYAGVPLQDPAGQPIGLLQMLFREPIPDPVLVEQMLQLFTGWASSELIRRHQERTLSESEQKFRLFYQDSPLSYQSLDINGHFLEVNPAWSETFGFNPEEVIGRSFASFMTPESAELVAQRFPLFKERGQVENAEFEMLRRDGSTVQILLNGKIAYDGQGRFVRTHCILVDITQEKQAERRLRRSEQRYRRLSQQFEALLQGISDRIVLLDKDCRVVWSNQPGKRSGDGNLTCCYEQYYGRVLPCDGCPAPRVLAEGELMNGQLETDDGRMLSLRAFPILGEDQDGPHILVMAQDITALQQRHEQDLRTGQLAAIGELAAGVAHEINNPITGVINYAQLILNQVEAEEEIGRFASRIIHEGDRVAGIVRQLLLLSRDEMDQTAPVDLTKALAETLALVGTQLHKEGIRLEVNLAEDLPLVHAQLQQLQQLFLNILSNARYALNKRFPEPGPDKTLLVALEQTVHRKRPCLMIIFRDQGIGISADLLPRVLQPFVTNKPSSEGTGLGLSISHEIVKKFDGEIEIKSREGAYTEVVVYLPTLVEEVG
jgi:PAS domain S-box-containing protein